MPIHACALVHHPLKKIPYHQLHIAAATVKRNAENIYRKLGVSGRQGAVAKAKSLGILEIDQ